MKPFQMGSVLEYRKQLEDLARQQLAETLAREQQLRDEITALDGDLHALHTELAVLHKEGTTVDRIILFENRITVLQEQLGLLHDRLSILLQQVKKARQELLLKSQDKRILEKLRDQQNLSYRKEQNRKEAIQLDEIAVIFHQKNPRS